MDENIPKKNESKHIVMMGLCCIVPMIIIAMLPLFGVSQGISLGVGLIIMVGMHVWMMRK